MDPVVKRETRERRNRAVANSDHVSLAPLTTRLPLRDDDYAAINSIPPPPHITSYLQTRSAPATPGLLSGPPTRSPSRGPSALASRRPIAAAGVTPLPKSKSASHLANNGNRARSAQSSLARRNRNNNHNNNNNHHQSDYNYTASDNLEWLHRVGALLTTEARESKGLGWQVAASRAGSTASLPGLLLSPNDFDSPRYREQQEVVNEYFAARHQAREREREAKRAAARALTLSRLGSRRGSRDINFSTLAASLPSSPWGSRPRTPGGGGGAAADRERWDDYFSAAMAEGELERARQELTADEDEIPGPDFVNLDERVEAEVIAEDEAYIRRLVKQASGGAGAWVARLFGMGFPDLDDDDNDEEEDGEVEEENGLEADKARRRRNEENLKRLHENAIITDLNGPPVPPPREEGGILADAAWLVKVSARTLFW